MGEDALADEGLDALVVLCVQSEDLAPPPVLKRVSAQDDPRLLDEAFVSLQASPHVDRDQVGVLGLARLPSGLSRPPAGRPR